LWGIKESYFIKGVVYSANSGEYHITIDGSRTEIPAGQIHARSLICNVWTDAKVAIIRAAAGAEERSSCRVTS